MFSFAGDVVLDPFAGTATTNLAAIETGRARSGIEIEPTYIDLIEKLGQIPLSGAAVTIREATPKSMPWSRSADSSIRLPESLQA